MRVDFYILTATAEQERLRTACRLADKAWQKGHRVFIHTQSAQAAKQVDEMLWTYRQDSFVPHALLRDRQDIQADRCEPVLVGDGTEEPEALDVLINLAESIPPFAARSARIAEIVSGDESARRAGRTRYRDYRERGVSIHQHNL
ncbi:MAG: DNA polymerase III subunit chi [Gammaproteobacteria bacterium]|nr:DNA polymerase III subunit chi [Gammaproteobacteria bacterium]NIV49355.1 DNA polymerase III subunit chi [Gammaproteobacteria bacterium]